MAIQPINYPQPLSFDQANPLLAGYGKGIDYSNTIIYKIVCNDLNIKDVYVGHTTNFTKRKQSHKKRCTDENNDKYHYKVYQTIREYGGWDNWIMVEIEKYPCNDMNEATKQERYWYEQLNAKLNMTCPYRESKNEARQAYAEKHHDRIKEKYEQIKEMLNEKRREKYKEQDNTILLKKSRKYYEDNKEKIVEKRIENREEILAKRKEYRAKEINKEKAKDYYEQNLDKIKARRSEKCLCACGINYTKQHKKRHEESKQHQEFIKLKVDVVEEV